MEGIDVIGVSAHPHLIILPLLTSCKLLIEFLRLCQNFGLTPMFTKIDEAKSNKWKQSSKQFVENVI